MNKEAFFTNGVATVKLTDWLNWASDTECAAPWRIVLPMIQRGTIWKPHQVIDLWDTLLRGMPLGSMLASMARTGEVYRDLKTGELLDPAEEMLSLLDGQQRTLSMLLAWPNFGSNIMQRIWIDLAVEDDYDHLFRFHFSTESHPFGFEPGGTSGNAVAKLSVSDRKAAYAAYADVYQATQGKPLTLAERRKKLWCADSVRPWRGLFPMDLQDVIRAFQQSADDQQAFDEQIKKRLGQWRDQLENRAPTLRSTDGIEVASRQKSSASPRETA